MDAQPPNSRPRSKREKRVYSTTFFALVVIVAGFLLRDTATLANSDNRQLAGHAGASALFTLACSGFYMARTSTRPPLPLIMLGGAFLTAIFEAAQFLSPARTPEWNDLLVGFGGALLGALAIESALRAWPNRTVLRVHAGTAGAVSLVLVALLVLDERPVGFRDRVPDGVACPLTTIDGGGERFEVGAGTATDGCFETAAGGLALIGPDLWDGLSERTTLVSSPLNELADRVSRSAHLVVRARITVETNDDGELRWPGVIAKLTSQTTGRVLLVRSHGGRVEAHGPDLPEIAPAAAFAQGVELGAPLLVEVELDGSIMRTRLDGQVVSFARLDPGWADLLAGVDDLQLLVGNDESRLRPLHGVIEWIEIEAD